MCSWNKTSYWSGFKYDCCTNKDIEVWEEGDDAIEYRPFSLHSSSSNPCAYCTNRDFRFCLAHGMVLIMVRTMPCVVGM